MKCLVKSLVVVLAVLAVPAYAAPYQVGNSFAHDLGGWSAINGSGWEYVAAGGPGGAGYALWTDKGSGRGTIVAPGSFLSGIHYDVYNNGALSFDLKVFDFGTNIDKYQPIEVILFADGKPYSYTAATAAEVKSWNVKGQEMDWTTLYIPMTAEAWGVNPATWSSILDNLSGLHIRMEVAVNMGTNPNGWDKVGIGGVLWTSIYEMPRSDAPEPATLAMLGTGALVLLRHRRR